MNGRETVGGVPFQLGESTDNEHEELETETRAPDGEILPLLKGEFKEARHRIHKHAISHDERGLAARDEEAVDLAEVDLVFGRIVRDRHNTDTSLFKPVHEGFHDMRGTMLGLSGMGYGHDTDAEGAMFLTGAMPYRVHRRNLLRLM